MNNIYTFLELVKKRPAMYMADYKNSLAELENMIWGYYQCIGFHKINEDVPSMNRHFLSWLGYTTDLLFLNYGWAYAINNAANKDDDLLKIFFSYVEKYKKLKPVIKSEVKINYNTNEENGKIKYGDPDFLDNPIHAEIIQYYPKNMYFVKLYFDDFIYEETLNNNIIINEIKEWMSEKYNIQIKEWTDK